MASVNGLIKAHGKRPLFSFGVISDVQYADIPDGQSFLGVPRYYQHSIVVLQRAVKTWNDRNDLKFSVNFGDIVDGSCPKEDSLQTVRKVVGEFDKFCGPVYHIIGNHCLYNLPRTTLINLLGMPAADDRAYYDFSPCSEYRIVVLDSYDISTIGWEPDHPNALEARKLLDEKNPNVDKNSPSGLVGLNRRFLMFNGGVGKGQLKWLDGVLEDASRNGQMVIVFGHLPMDPGASSVEALMWNYAEVLDVIHKHRCVKACIAGHDHKGGYSVDSFGVHHRVLEAALECPHGSDAFGCVDVYRDKLSLLGTDRMASTEMIFTR